MKKIILFLLLLLCFELESQIKKGNFLIGGTASFTADKIEISPTDKRSILAFGINPNFGYFVLDKLALGCGASYGATIIENQPTRSAFGVNSFARYYFLKPDKVINFFTTAGYGYGVNYNDGKKVSDGNTLTCGLGTAIFFNDSIALDFVLEFSNNQSSFGKNNQIFLNIGFQIFLEK